MFRYTVIGLVIGLAFLVQPAGAAEKNPVVVIDTSMGAIEVELYQDKAPVTVANFLSYVTDKFYDGTIFHRVMPDFMIQGGGFTPDLQRKETKKPIKNESDNGLKNETGTLAMARTNIPDSATSQFFINVADNAALDKANAQDGVGYCVFGKVIKGLEVVNKIKAVKTSRKSISEALPDETVKINSIKKKEG